MNHIRWTQLMENESLSLTQEEKDQGWHFCPDWDYLLISPESAEYKSCNCKLKGL